MSELKLRLLALTVLIIGIVIIIKLYGFQLLVAILLIIMGNNIEQRLRK